MVPLRKCVAFFVVLPLSGCLLDQSTNPNACSPVQPSILPSGIRTPDLSHIPQAVQDYSDEGQLASEGDHDVTVVLQLNNEGELDRRISEMYTPGHSNFHHFVKPAEFRSRYAPTAQQMSATMSYLESKGLRTEIRDANGYLVHARGTSRALEDTFQTSLHSYRAKNWGRHFAPANEPVMPAGIRAVHGLSDFPSLKSHLMRPAAGLGTGPGLTPQMIRAAYNFPNSLDGSGQTVALVELDGYSMDDVQAYTRTYGLPMPSIRNVLVDGFSGSPGVGADEVTLDIEMIAAVAPGAEIVVYEGPNSGQTMLDIFSQIASDGKASQVSVSWGSTEGQNSTSFLQSENAVLKQLAAQGQAVFVATGDQGAYDDSVNLSVRDPASQPFVVAVGGTRLSTSGGSYLGETTWNEGTSNGASGGGVSSIWAQPSWQSGAVSGQSLGSTSMRNIPDVSLNSDPGTGYAIQFQGSPSIAGGTSAAAPIWAAFLALVNQNRAMLGRSPIGFPNPAFYAIGKGGRYLSDFHDVNDGATNLFYPSVTGFDDATGWGTPNGQALFQDLSTEPSASPSDLSC